MKYQSRRGGTQTHALGSVTQKQRSNLNNGPPFNISFTVLFLRALMYPPAADAGFAGSPRLFMERFNFENSPTPHLIWKPH